MNYNWNWKIFWEQTPEGTGTYLDTLLSGLQLTIEMTIIAWLIALLVGSVVGVARTLPSPMARRLGAIYVELFRNIPLLVQLFIWYFVVPELVPHSIGLWLKQLPHANFYTASIGLGLFTAARVAEQVRAGINSLPRGQRMAATALGLRTTQTYFYVLLPMAYRIILPPLTSEFLNCIKNTSVSLTLGVLELTARARSMQEYSFQTFEAFTAATLIYLIVNLTVTAVMRVVERRVAVPGYIAGK